jgi:hypothetical protein
MYVLIPPESPVRAPAPGDVHKTIAGIFALKRLGVVAVPQQHGKDLLQLQKDP